MGQIDRFRVLRELRKAPTLLGLAILTQGLGIAGAVVLLAVAVGVRESKPAGVATPSDSLAQMRLVDPTPFYHATIGTFSFPQYLALQQTPSFIDLAAFVGGSQVTVRQGAAEEVVRATLASRSYLSVLGVQPTAGRGFTATEDSEAGSYVCLLSERLVRRWGLASPVEGAVLIVNDRPTHVVGILPAMFEGTNYNDRADIWLPLSRHAQLFPDGGLLSPERSHLWLIAQLRSGVERTKAERDAQAIMVRYRGPLPLGASASTTIALDPLLAYNHVERFLLAPYYGAFGLVAALLLVMSLCNSANLGIVLSARRQRETAIRLSLGAGPARVLQERLLEAATVGALGTVSGVGFAIAAIRVLDTVTAGPTLQRLLSTAAPTSWQTAMLATALSLATALAAAALPAWRAAHAAPMIALGGRNSYLGTRTGVKTAMLFGQVVVTTTLALLAVASLRSVALATNASPGFDGRDLSFLRIRVSPGGHDALPATTFGRRLLERLNSDPLIKAATLSRLNPIEPSVVVTKVGLFQADGALSVRNVPYDEVASNYFDALGIPVLAGREFHRTGAGCAEGLADAIVNESAAREWSWPHNQPLGATLRVGSSGGRTMTVVGIVGDVKFRGILSPSAPFLYLPLERCHPSVMDQFGLTLAVRGSPSHQVVEDSVHRAIAPTKLKVIVEGPRPLSSLKSQSVTFERMLGWINFTFGTMALVVCGVGLFAIVAQYSVQREREFGVHLALGARAMDLTQLLARSGLAAVGFGIVVGLCLGVLATVAIQRIAGIVLSVDGLVVLVVVGTVFAAAAIAIFQPLRQVLRVDPASVLRMPAELS